MDFSVTSGRATVRGFEWAADAIDQRTGFVARIREKPLAAMGIAFTTGLGLALAVGRRGPRHWLMEQARGQLRTALLAGVTGFLAAELQEYLDGDDDQGLIADHLGDSADPNDEDENEDRDLA